MNIDQRIESALKQPLEISIDQSLAQKVQRKIAMKEILEEQRRSKLIWWLNASLVAISILLLIVFLGPERASSLVSYILWVGIPLVLIMAFNRLEERFIKPSS